MMNSWYRGWIRGKTRILFAWTFVLVLGAASKTFPTLPGIVLCFLGASLRFWASGYLRKDNRLAIGGPYAWVRNPLYLGTYLMAIGISWALSNLWLLILVSVLFAMIYHYIILDEEAKLHGIFGEAYSTYCQLVPRFFPRPWPAPSALLVKINSEPNHRHYSWKIAIQNKAYEAYASFAGLVVFTSGIAYFFQKLQ